MGKEGEGDVADDESETGYTIKSKKYKSGNTPQLMNNY